MDTKKQEPSGKPGFSVKRLKPIVQVTKHGRVELLQSGHLVLDFNGDSERMVIDGDGEKVNKTSCMCVFESLTL